LGCSRIHFIRTQAWIPAGDKSWLLTRIAATESDSLCARMKSWLRFWSWKRRFGLPEGSDIPFLPKHSARAHVAAVVEGVDAMLTL
jgi:hypothetical protein